MASMQRTWRRAWGYERPSWQSMARFNLLKRRNKLKSKVRYNFAIRNKKLTQNIAASIAAIQLLSGGLNSAYAASNISVDNRTATTVTNKGNVTDVYTTTYKGQNAFNSFKNFNVSQGDIVNLHLTNGSMSATNLLNYVSGGQMSIIAGMLNGIKDGKIGGHVYLLNPYGFMVSNTGSVNVGRLTMATPSQSSIDDFLNNKLNGQAVDNSYWSSFKPEEWTSMVPLSADGSIVVQGKVNASNGISMRSKDMTNSGTVSSGVSFTASQPDFSDVVNANGLTSGDKIAVDGGTVEIVATNNITNSGKIANEGADKQKGGTINLKAGNDITLQRGGVVSAKGNGINSGGGTVNSYAQHDAVMEKDAKIDVSGGNVSGDGGYAEFSAKDTVTIRGGQLSAKATNGKVGTVLIDPTDIVLDGGISDPSLNVSVDQLSNGGNITLEATGSITANNVVISSRQVGESVTAANQETAASVGDSGNITIKAPKITLGAGTKVLANADHGYKGGDVDIEANSVAAIDAVGYKEAIASIQVGDDSGGAVIKGTNVTLHASATALNDVILPDTGDSAVVSAGKQTVSIVTGAVSTLPQWIGDLTGVVPTFSYAKTSATITVKKDSFIKADNKLAMQAETQSGAGSRPYSLPDLQLSVSVPWAGGIEFSGIDAKTAVSVEKGSTLTAKDLSILTHNDANLETEVSVASENGTKKLPDFALALGLTDVSVNAASQVDGTLNVSNNVLIGASNTGSYSTAVDSSTSGQGNAAAAIAYAKRSTNAAANLTGNVPDAASVSVLASNNISGDSTTASTHAGETTSDAIKSSIDDASTFISDDMENKLVTIVNKFMEQDDGGAARLKQESFRISGAMAIADSSDNAKATIGGGTMAQTVHATGAVVVGSQVNAQDIDYEASAAAVSDAKKSTGDTSKQSYSAGVALATNSHSALAEILPNVTVTAKNIGVASEILVPIRSDLFTGDTLNQSTALSSIVSTIDGIKDVSKVFNGQSSAKSTSDGTGGSADIAGSASILTFNNTSRAVVDTGAKLNLVGKPTGSWSSDSIRLDDGEDAGTITFGGKTYTYRDAVDPTTVQFAFDKQADVIASNDVTLVFLGGAVMPNTSTTQTGLGMVLNLVSVNSTADALVREGATIQDVTDTASGDIAGSRSWTQSGSDYVQNVGINADNKDRVISLVTSSGTGATYGIDGSIAVTNVSETTRALVDDEATVKALQLDVDATAAPVVWSVSGGFTLAKGASAGVGIAYNNVTGDTEAEIADNDTISIDSNERTSQRETAGATITSPDIDVEAHTGGYIGAIAVTPTVVNQGDSSSSSPGFLDSLKTKYDTIKTKVATLVADKPKSVGGDSTTPAAPDFGLAGAGSGSVNETGLTNTAKIDHATIDQSKPSGSTDAAILNVRGTSDPTLLAAAGAAAVTRANGKSQNVKVGVTGSVAVNMTGNGNSAILSNSTVSSADDVNVQALSSGDQVSVAIGMGADVSKQGADATFSANGSVSLTLDQSDKDGKAKNFTKALVEDSTINGDVDGKDRNINVTAYNSTTVGTGGGALEIQPLSSDATGLGIGATVTYVDVKRDVTSEVSGSTMKDVDTIGVNAYNSSKIAAAGATASVTNDSNTIQLAGTVVISTIHNNTTAEVDKNSQLTTVNAVDVTAQNSKKDKNLEALIDAKPRAAENLNYNAAGNLDSDSDGILALAGNIQASRGSNAGVSVVYSEISDHITAEVLDSKVTVSAPNGSIDITASSDADIMAMAIGIGASKDNFSGGGSVVVSEINNNVTALTGKEVPDDLTKNTPDTTPAATLTANQVTIDAADKSTIQTLGGQVNVAANNTLAMGLAFTLNEINNQAAAYANNVKIEALTNLNPGDSSHPYESLVTIAGHNTSTIDSIAASGAVSTSGSGVAGSVTANIINNKTTGEILNSSDVNASSGTVNVTVEDTGKINSLAGSVAGSGGTASAGAAFAYNSIKNENTALVDASTVKNAETLNVTGSEKAAIRTLSAAVSAGNTVGISGSMSDSEIGNKTYAGLTKSAVSGGSTNAKVVAGSTGEIDSLAGSVAVAVGSTSVGLGVAVNRIANTANAYISGSDDANTGYHFADLNISSNSGGTIKTIAVGVAAGEDVGAAGSFATNIMTDTTKAYIDGGAKVTATNNAGVLSENDDSIDVLGGAAGVGLEAAGVGLTVVVNDIEGSTEAYITGTGTQVDAKGKGDAIAVNTGELVTTVDVSKINAKDLLIAPDLTEKTTDVKGLAVVATSHQTVIADAASMGVGAGAGVTALPITNLMSGETHAYIEGGAQIDTRLTDFTAPQVYVNASSQSFSGNLILGVAGGSYAATGAVSTNNLQRKTYSDVSGATIGALAVDEQHELTKTGSTLETKTDSSSAGSGSDATGYNVTENYNDKITKTLKPTVGTVTVKAKGAEHTADIVAGLSAGMASGAATAVLNIFAADTRAYVQTGSVAANALSVQADTDSGFNAVAGAGAFSYEGGGAGAFVVGVNNNTTKAYVGDITATDLTTVLSLAGDLDVDAAMNNEFNSIIAGGSVSGKVGIAGAVGVNVITNTTEAGLYYVKNTAKESGAASPEIGTPTKTSPVSTTEDGITNTTTTVTTPVVYDYTKNGLMADSMGNVTVKANENVKVNSKAGSLAGGVVAGLGAGVNIAVLKSQVDSQVLNSNITTPGTFSVTAGSTKDIDAFTASGGAGLGGLSGAVSLILVGSGDTGSAISQLEEKNSVSSSGILSEVDSFSSSSQDANTQSNLADDEATRLKTAGTYKLKDTIGSTSGDGVNAKVSGTTLNAKSVKVDANAVASTSNTVGSGSIGLVLGAGGAVGYTRIYDNVAATIETSKVTSPDVEVNAGVSDGKNDGTDPVAKVKSYAGSAGYVGLGAAVADAVVDNTVTASAGGTFNGDDSTDSKVTVNAADSSSVSTEGIGASVGAAAVGIVISDASKKSTIKATAAADSVFNKYQLLDIEAKSMPIEILVGGKSTSPVTYYNMVSSTATGAAGGLGFAGTGAEADAFNATQVIASIGAGVTLPDGDVSVFATNTSQQYADALGVAGAGLFAASGAVANATAGDDQHKMVTYALVGDDVNTSSERTGNLKIMAKGIDTNTAKATAGAGGVAAGNAAVANTKDDADVIASIGNGDAGKTLYTNLAVIDAEHVDNYSSQADSHNASLVGGSGADAEHTADSTVQAKIGDNLHLVTYDSVNLTAINSFVTQDIGDNDNAYGAGGGVVNGAAATSFTTITGNANVVLGNNTNLTSGLDYLLKPGGITLLADSYLATKDQVVLKTGGAIAGAGTDSEITATLNNNVTTGNNDKLYSYGNINIGSYTNASATTSAYVNTWGVASVGTAEADTDITTNQNVTINGGGSDFTAFGNVNITAGNAPDGSYNTKLTGSATGEGYVIGLIAVPVVSADTDFTSNATLNINSGAAINSVQNTTLGAYHGYLLPTANGTGHGYELGFIPVTTGSSNSSAVESGKVTQNGTVTAGIYHDLEIAINDAGLTQSSGAPVLTAHYNSFDVQDYINKNYTGVEAGVMRYGTSGTPVSAYQLGTLYASGGSITINADELAGSGSLTAYGAPKINVQNSSQSYLILEDITIPNLIGGKVNFTGAAGKDKYGGTVTTQGSNDSPKVIIQNTYNNTVGDGTNGPAILLTGDIENLGGLVQITNKMGSLGQVGQINAQTLTIEVLNGSYTVNATSDDGYLSLGSSPYALWQNLITWPGGNPSSGLPGTTMAIAYVANATFNSDGKCTDSDSLMKSIIGKAGDTDNESIVFLGDGLPYCKGDYSKDTAKSLSPIGSAYAISTSCGGGWFASIPTLSLTKTVQNYPTEVLNQVKTSSISAKNIAVEAKYIDINGTINAGQSTDWSLALPDSLKAELDLDKSYYDLSKALGLNSVSPLFNISLSKINSSDSQINAIYDAQNNRIIIENNLIAAAGGASVVLNGGIISTNPLGKIHVNGGLGEVTVDNATGVEVELQNINTGNLSSPEAMKSSVEIIDTLQDSSSNHWLYSYMPGVGISTYHGAQATAATDLASVSSTGTSSSTTYQPLTGLAWKWVERATLGRTVNYDNWSVSNWTWTSGTANNPWLYEQSDGNWGTTPSGQIAKTGQSNLAAFSETIIGSYGYDGARYSGINIAYHDPDKHGICNFGFKETGTDSSGRRAGIWTYMFPTSASLTLTMQAKADNPVSIDFSGNAKGLVKVTSNAPVLLAGNIVNPNGDTIITVTGSGNGIKQASAGSLLTNNLDLSSVTGIGSLVQPFNATLTNGGMLTAQSTDGSIYLNLGSAAVIGSIIAGNSSTGYGDVVVSAAGSLTPQSGTSVNVTGSNITLNTTAGNIGSESAPLVLSAHTTSLANNGTSGGVVNIGAPGDIGIKEIDGDLLVGQIASTASGNIYIDVPNGTLYNASGQTAAQSLSADQIAQVWKNLGLREEDGAETGKPDDASVVNFQNTVNRYYQQYWQLRNLGTVSDGSLALSADGIEKMRRQAAANLKKTNPTDQEINDYANSLYQTDCSYLALVEAGGIPSASRGTTAMTPVDLTTFPDYVSYNSKFAYTATTGQITALTSNAVWTEAQLRNAISQSALEPSSGTPVGNTVPNIAGRDVTIKAGYAIGKLADPVIVSLSDLKKGNLTDEQKAALALAKAPGDVHGVGINTEGKTVNFAFKLVNGQLALPSDITTLTGFQFVQTAPVYVDAAGKITALASLKGTFSSVYLQGAGVSQNLSIDKIEALGNINLTSPLNITAAVDASGHIYNPYQIKGANITLVSGTGSIGSDSVPLVYWASGGILNLASAGQDIYLDNYQGDMVLGSVAAANGTVALTSPGSIYANDQNALTIQGKYITLKAQDAIGQDESKPLRVVVSADGSLGGSAGGGVYLYSPDNSHVADLDLAISDLTAGGALWLQSDGDITIGGSVQAQGDMELDAAADVSLNGGILNALSGHAVDINAGKAITETSLAAVTGDNTKSAALGKIITQNLTTMSKQGQNLLGDNQIASQLDATDASSGDIVIHNAANSLLTIDKLAANNGDIEVATGGALILGDNIATAVDKNITLIAGGTETIGKAVMAGGSGHITLQADGTASDIILSAPVSSINGNITIEAGRDINLAGDLSTGGNVKLAAGRAITESGSAKVTDAALLTTQSHGAQMLNGGNAVRAFQAVNTGSGSIELTNGGTPLAINGVTQQGGDLLVNNMGDICIDGSIDTVNTVMLTAGGAITETGNGKVLNAALLTTQSNNGQTLNGANTVHNFAAVNTGSGDIALTNAVHPLTIVGINETGGNITVSNTGDICLDGTIDAISNVSLTANGAITETTNGKVMNAALLTTHSSNGQTLNGMNTVHRFEAANSGGGDIFFTNVANPLTIAGISEAGGNVTVNNAGDVCLDGSIDTAGSVTLLANGAIAETTDGKVLNAMRLTTVSQGKQILNGENSIYGFEAINNGSGDIAFTNASNSLIVINISQNGGNVAVSNTKDIRLDGSINTVNNVSLSAGEAITETENGKVLNAALLTTHSGSGQILNGANTVHSFAAVNTGSGDIAFTNTANPLSISGISETGGNVTVSNTGDILLDGSIDTVNNVSLTANGAITETANGRVLNSVLLTTYSRSGQTLNGANTVHNFAAVNTSSGDIAFTNTANPLSISGISETGGNVTVNNTKDIRLDGSINTVNNVSLTAGDAITETANGKVLNAALLITHSGSGQILNGANTVHSFAAVNTGSGDIALTNTANPLTVTGISQNGGNVLINNTGDILLDGSVDTVKQVSLTANGAITETANGRVLNAALLTTHSGSGQTLNGVNTVHGFEAINSSGGDIAFTNTANPLSISGISETGGNVTVNNTGDILIDGSIDTVNNVSLAASGMITEASNGKVLNAAMLTTNSGSGQTLNGANTVHNFATVNTNSGDIALTNTANPLSISGISETGGNVTVNNTGNILLDGSIDIVNNVSLTANGAITETANGKVLNAAVLTTHSSNGQTLNGANTVHSFAAVNTGSGDIAFTNTANPLSISGISETGGNVTVNNTGDILLDGSIDTARQVSLTASGAITETANGRVLNAVLLTTQSQGAQLLNGANTVYAFNAVNNGSGNIELVNGAVPLDISGVNLGSGNLSIHTGDALTVTGVIAAGGGNVDLNAGGSIAESGRIENAALLTTQSQGAQLLKGANKIYAFNAVNTGNGNIELVNDAGLLAINGISQGGGDVSVNNDGVLTVNGAMLVGGNGNLALKATGTNSDISLNAAVTTNGNVTLDAGGKITENGSGKIVNAALLTTNSQGGQTLNGTNAVHGFNAANAGGGSIALSNETPQLAIEQAVQQNGGSITFDQSGDLILRGPVSTTDQVTLKATREMTEFGSGQIIAAVLDTLSSGGQQLSGANQVAVLQQAMNQGSGDLSFNNQSGLQIKAIVAENGNILVDTAGDLTVDAEIHTAADKNIVLTSQGSQILNQLLQAGGNGTISLKAAGSTSDIQLNQAVSSDSGNLQIAAGRNILGGGLGLRGQNIQLSAGTGSIGLAGSPIKLTVGGTLEGSAQAGIDLSADGDVAVASLVSQQGDIHLLASGSLHLGTVRTTGDVTLTAQNSILNAVPNETDINIAGRNVKLTADNESIGVKVKPVVVDVDGILTASAPQGIYLIGKGSLQADKMISSAGAIAITTTDQGLLHIGEVQVATAMTLRSDNITLDDVEHMGKTDMLAMDISGASRPTADNVTINVTSLPGIQFTDLNANTAYLRAHSDSVTMTDTNIHSRADIFTNNFHVVTDNRPTNLFNSDVIFCQLRDAFDLNVSGTNVNTNATVLNHKGGVMINGSADQETAVTTADRVNNQPIGITTPEIWTPGDIVRGADAGNGSALPGTGTRPGGMENLVDTSKIMTSQPGSIQAPTLNVGGTEAQQNPEDTP